ncbi:hypothetical protein B0I32_117177 [Nonomuraea fuscirosea]|uniref:Uncharacterized protein n=1 Tax=Nonomuraea fuscirosea TaxID=1291556 RepID=A0A2T0MQH4_9ACTN|nr:hypothetical protein B0I32_117177 [Nonomuraea fuscirosea]
MLDKKLYLAALLMPAVLVTTSSIVSTHNSAFGDTRGFSYTSGDHKSATPTQTYSKYKKKYYIWHFTITDRKKKKACWTQYIREELCNEWESLQEHRLVPARLVSGSLSTPVRGAQGLPFATRPPGQSSLGL